MIKLPSVKFLLKFLMSNKSILEQKSKYLNSITVFPFFSSHFSFEMKLIRNFQVKTKERSEAVVSACNFIKETLTQVFSCEFCEISKGTFSNRTPRVAASERWKIVKLITLQRTFFTQVTRNKVSDHYARNVYIKVVL